MNRGCIATNYVESTGAERKDGLWVAKARDVIDGKEVTIQSKVLINAAGPFVDEYNRTTDEKTEHHHVFSKGIHLIVKQITPHISGMGSRIRLCGRSTCTRRN